MSVNLTAFPLGKTLYVGDILEFIYTPYTSAVFLVDVVGFTECTPARGVSLGIMGNTSYTLPTTGLFYFISFFNDCLLGQKLAIEVHEDQRPCPNNV
ncbi:hypothetical protein ACH5RR_026530 [Cinchona calisaya]|uniref:Phytocyanin domain-containing protein n=1 Tax=Cinchona calisaya TaxID=153742 RepID=A0ABD2Z7U8_9GENT